jgi:protein O-mannosyl-transferase
MSHTPNSDSLPGDGNRPPKRRPARKTPSSPAATREPNVSSLPHAGPERLAVCAVCGFLLLAVALVFGQTVTYEFVNFDDPDYIYNNSRVMEGLTFDGILWAMTTRCDSNWHPLTWLSHMLDCDLHGLYAGGHHLTSVLLHAITSLLLFLVLRQMTGSLWPSAFVAAVFAIHPLHVESVAWVTERKDVLSGLCFVLTLAAYLGYVRRPFSLLRYLAVVATFALGLTAKPMLVTLPFVLLLLDYWPLARFAAKPLAASQPPWQPLLLEKLPLLLLTIASCALTVWAQEQSMVGGQESPLSTRIANALMSYVAYLGKSFCPMNLAAYYPHPQAGFPAWKPIAAFVLLAGVTAVVWIRRRKNPYLLVGWLWYLGMLVPVIGLLQVGLQAMADRYTYLPQIGLLIAVAWGAEQLVRSWPRRAWLCGVAASLAMVELIVGALQQTTYWHDSGSLWKHTLECTSENKIAHCNYGAFLAEQGRLDDAVVHYREAVRIMPTYALAQFSLGMTLGKLGRCTEAVGPLREVLKLAPDFAEARSGLALALADEGHFDEAMVEFEKAIALAEEQGKLPLLESLKARMRMMSPENSPPKMPSSPIPSPTRPRQSP